MTHIKPGAWGRVSVGMTILFLLTTSSGNAEPPFKHKPHESIACLTCHEREDGHGAVKIKTAVDCAGCHHSAENLKGCTGCHTERQIGKPFRYTFGWKFSTSPATVRRSLAFEHEQHQATRCITCHAPAAGMRATENCSSCHKEHHDELRNCNACHVAVGKIAAHDNPRTHVTCSGSGCHRDEATATLRTQRNVCLACHNDKVEHHPNGDCATCHMIPKHAKEKR